MTEAEQYLNQIPMWASKKNTLEDIRAYLEELGNPDRSMRIIHVAGTNGKGSVCAFLTSVLTGAGYATGTFVSPHLEETRERFLLNGEKVSEKNFERAWRTVREVSQHMEERGYHPPTYFEFLFYMFLVICRDNQPDFVILETGLGGRLDVTNVIEKPVLTVITSISLDHVEYLGDTIKQIAAEKAGIFKPGVPVVFDDCSPEASEVILERAGELFCTAYPVGAESYQLLEQGDGRLKCLVKSPETGQMVLELSTGASYQMQNGALAVTVIGCLVKQGLCRLSAGEIGTGMKSTFWPARMEELLPGVYLDGAHNAGGIEALVQTMERFCREKKKKIHLLFAAVSDKDYKIMIRELCRHVDLARVLVVQMESARGLDPQIMAQEFQKYLEVPVDIFASAKEAWDSLLKQKPKEDLAFCAGSLYFAGEIRQLVRRKHSD